MYLHYAYSVHTYSVHVQCTVGGVHAWISPVPDYYSTPRVLINYD